MKIIDGHSHMINTNILEKMLDKIGGDEKERLMHEFTDKTPEEHKTEWIQTIDKLGIEKTIFMAINSLNPDFLEFINSSDRFFAMAQVNLLEENALDKLKKEIEAGMSGVKLYASGSGFDVGDKKYYPIYEYCDKNNLPIVIHFGVSIGQAADLRYGNPVLLSRVLRDFPKVKFIIAHFGAGFFREVLMLKYKQKNLFVDTSGTNNWMVNQDTELTLKYVFKKAIEVFTPQGIIFGTDTRIFPDGYREHILKEQMQVLDELNVSEKDKEDIMYNNANRILLNNG